MMGDTEDLIALARGVFRRVGQGTAAEAWPLLTQTGLAGLSVPEAAGGSGGSLTELVAVLKTAGAAALRAPLAETAMLAGWALSESGSALQAGPYTAAQIPRLTVERAGGTWALTGTIPRVPSAQAAAHLVLAVPYRDATLVAWLRRDQYGTRQHANLAGEPRDDVILADQRVPGCLHAGPGLYNAFRDRGALARAAQIAGAARQSLDASVTYAAQRVQFGRPIADFQIIETYLAEMAAEVTILDRALDAAAGNMQSGQRRALISLAAAKVQAGLTATRAAKLAHQIHGAIGLTQEHSLHEWTMRLWAWRDEYGNEPYWSTIIAEELRAAAGTESEVWRQLSNAVPEGTPAEG
jgi:acyl-CoA dehydrogenase